MNRTRVFVGTAILLMGAAAFFPTPFGAGIARAGDETTPPKLIPSCMVQPVYPEQEKAAGIQGTVVLSVEVKEDGKVGDIATDQQVEGHPAFASSAMAAVGKWCFEPAQNDGKAVACTIKIPVRFALEEKKK